MGNPPGTETLHWAWYTDPDVLRLECERVFGSAGRRAVEARLPGLRAFVNVCRHRGSEIASVKASATSTSSGRR